jgi:magnesium-transporting ATPase (P-type)
VLKGTEAVAKAECELQAKENMLFAGTAISNGICIGMVTSIGMDTEIGKIQSQIQVGTWHMHVCTCKLHDANYERKLSATDVTVDCAHYLRLQQQVAIAYGLL